MSRERKRCRRIVLRAAWVNAGREDVRLTLDRGGVLRIDIPDVTRVDGPGRERAAHWLRTEVAPQLDHEAAYALLWTD